MGIIMNTTFKNKKYKKINRTIKRNKNILKGGKNFIEYLFNVNDKCEINNVDKNESEGNKKGEHKENSTDTKIKKVFSYTDNILEKWIENTSEGEGMVLYFAKEIESDSNEHKKEETNNWVQGFHGSSLQNKNKIELNKYVINRLESSDKEIDKKRLQEINSKKNNGCLESLNQIQTKDIVSITERVEMNTKINIHLSELMIKNRSSIENEEKELEEKIQEMRKQIE